MWGCNRGCIGGSKMNEMSYVWTADERFNRWQAISIMCAIIKSFIHSSSEWNFIHFISIYEEVVKKLLKWAEKNLSKHEHMIVRWSRAFNLVLLISLCRSEDDLDSEIEEALYSQVHYASSLLVPGSSTPGMTLLSFCCTVLHPISLASFTLSLVDWQFSYLGELW